MKLRYIVGIESEIKEILYQVQNRDSFMWRICQNEKELEADLKKKVGRKEESLLIAATDETIALGKRLGVAVMAYLNPKIPGQSYSGVEMLVEGFEEVDTEFLERVYQRCHHLPWTILETERCIVRELTLDDLDELFEMYADDEIDKYTESLYEYEEEKTYQDAYINHMYRYFGYGMWLVFHKEDRLLIGRAGLEHREYNGETELELGYLIRREYQGQGYATEVCEAILNYACEYTDFSRINTLVDSENIASIGLTKKLGFVYVNDFEMDGRRMHRFIKELPRHEEKNP